MILEALVFLEALMILEALDFLEALMFLEVLDFLAKPVVHAAVEKRLRFDNGLLNERLLSLYCLNL